MHCGKSMNQMEYVVLFLFTSSSSLRHECSSSSLQNLNDNHSPINNIFCYDLDNISFVDLLERFVSW